jgi:hypothetical protein
MNGPVGKLARCAIYTCVCRKLDSAILVMKTAEDRP